MIYACIYWLAVRCYAWIVRVASLFDPKAKLFVAGRKGLLDKIQQALASESRPRVWIHCASLGEFEQGRPVIENLRSRYKDYAYVVTFFSPSGYEVRKDYKQADYVFYLPLDSPHNAKAFLDIVQPALCIFVKYEFWYYYLAAIAKRRIPAILVSANFRKHQLFFKWYGALQRQMLATFTHVFVQNEPSAALLNAIGYKDVTIGGDTRFDRVLEAVQVKQELPIAASFKKGKTIVAGSTWKEDEVFLATAFMQLPPEWKMILVPHEVDNKHIAEVEKLYSGICVKWSAWSRETDKRVLIVDRVGLLLQLYGYGDIAWIGGGFGKEGVHNILEAAVHGIPVLFGPVFHQFIEAGELIHAGGAFCLDDPGQLVNKLQELCNNSPAYNIASTAAKNYVLSKSGATATIINYLETKKLLRIL